MVVGVVIGVEVGTEDGTVDETVVGTGLSGVARPGHGHGVEVLILASLPPSVEQRLRRGSSLNSAGAGRENPAAWMPGCGLAWQRGSGLIKAQPWTSVSGSPVRQLQPLHTTEFSDVVAHQGGFDGQGVAGNPEIIGADGRGPPFQGRGLNGVVLANA